MYNNSVRRLGNVAGKLADLYGKRGPLAAAFTELYFPLEMLRYIFLFFFLDPEILIYGQMRS